MGPPIRPIVANLYRETLTSRPLTQLSILPRVWKRCVDDTFVVIESSNKERFLEHINKMDPHIQLIADGVRADGSISFLDTLVMPQPDNSLTTTLYRKPHTHRVILAMG